MKAKIISIVASSLCISGFAGTTYAEEYYSNQNNSDGYYSSQSNSNHYRSNPDYETKRHHKDERKGVSISVNMPGYGSYVVDKNDRHFIPAGPRHHRPNGPEWIDLSYGMPIPESAVTGGFEHHQTLYVCRGNYRGSVHPGKVVAGTCHISWGGDEVSLTRYQILTSYSRLNWISVRYGDIPANAIPGGYEHRNPLYICQAQYHGGLHPGKVVGRMCNIGWGGREVSIPNYNVLVG